MLVISRRKYYARFLEFHCILVEQMYGEQASLRVINKISSGLKFIDNKTKVHLFAR